jgi:hypothetical protein
MAFTNECTKFDDKRIQNSIELCNHFVYDHDARKDIEYVYSEHCAQRAVGTIVSTTGPDPKKSKTCMQVSMVDK